MKEKLITLFRIETSIRSCLGTKKLWKMQLIVILIIIGALGKIPKSLVKYIGEVENRSANPDYVNYTIVKISRNTEKSSGGLRRLAFFQIQVKECELTLEKLTKSNHDNNLAKIANCSY